MADYQRVVEFLRDFRGAAVQAVTDEVRDAAAAYAALSAEANDRLRQCNTLLQQGLRSEAINLADASPNLLDLVAALDLPDPEGWAEFCQRNDLPVPPPLQIDRAAQLNDAYGQDQPLEQLFSRHRRLALAHAPVLKRLDVMRQIAQTDPSPFWDKDIRTFERARFKEMRVALATAIPAKDLATITALSTEVLDTPWLDPVPSDLQTAAGDVNERLRMAQLDTELSQVVARLRTAFAAKSVSECATLLTQVKELLATHNRHGLPAAYAAEVEPIVAWVQEEKRLRNRQQAFAAACDALSQAINLDVPDAQLETAHRNALGHDQPLPPELQERYNAALVRRAGAMKRKFLAIAAVIVFVLLLGAGILWSVMQSRLAGGWADKIHKAAADRNLVLARQYVEAQEKNAPKLNDSPAVAAAKQEVAVLQKQADAETAVLTSAVTALDQTIRAVDAARTEAASLDQMQEAHAAAEAALARAKSTPDVSWVDPEKRFPAAVARVTRGRDDLHDRIARGVVSKADQIALQADNLNTEPRAATLDAAEKALAAMEKDLYPLRPFADRGTPGEAAVDAAVKKVTARKDAVARARSEFKARQALASAGGSADSARQALLDFAQHFPDSPSSRDFTRAASVADLYKSVEVWLAVSGTWAATPAPAGEKPAEQRLEAVRGFLAGYPASPIAPRAAAYADYLQQAADAMALQNTWQKALKDDLATPLIADLKYLQTSDGQKYYVLGDPNIKTRGLNDRVTYTFDAVDPADLARRKTITVPPPKTLVTPKPAPVPHALFAQALGEMLKTADRNNWESFGVDVVARIAAEDKIDPVVRATLLLDALTATARVDGWAVGDVYDKAIGDLTRQRLDLIVWYDPDKPVPDATVKNLATIVASLPKPAEVKQLLAARRAQVFRWLQPMFGSSGLLLRDEDGKWTIRTPGAVAGSDKVAAWAIVPPAGYVPPAAPSSQPTSQPAAAAPATPAAFVRVAVWNEKDKALAVDEAAVRDLPEGSMVLITRGQ